MIRALVSAAVALALAGSAGACSRDRESEGTRDSTDRASSPEAAAPSGGHDHAGMTMPGTTSNESRTPNPDREIVLAPEMIQRAGIQLVEARKGTATTRLHLDRKSVV